MAQWPPFHTLVVADKFFQIQNTNMIKKRSKQHFLLHFLRGAMAVKGMSQIPTILKTMETSYERTKNS